MNTNTQESQKMAAAVAAVFSYIRAQEDAAVLNLSTSAAQPLVAPAQAAAPALWGISGRQDMMSMRNLMQLRTFQGSKLR